MKSCSLTLLVAKNCKIVLFIVKCLEGAFQSEFNENQENLRKRSLNWYSLITEYGTKWVL